MVRGGEVEQEGVCSFVVVVGGGCRWLWGVGGRVGGGFSVFSYFCPVVEEECGR